jgi:ketosteroid isomerase-like protein
MDEHLVRKSVDEANRAFAAAAGRKEYAGMAALYTEDAVVLPPDGPIVTGRNAIADFWRAAATGSAASRSGRWASSSTASPPARSARPS